MLVGTQKTAREDRIILPWEAVYSKFTQDCYERRSCQFLVFAGYMNPKLWNHANPTESQVNLERGETQRAMEAFIRSAVKDQEDRIWEP